MPSPSEVATTTIRLTSLDAFAFRGPIDEPIKVAFGTFEDRPCVLVRAVDADGTEGWGEVWCNWPQVGAEHRARLVNEVIAPRLLGTEFAGPEALFDALERDLEVLVLQTGEIGPFAQAIAGIDIALWDLVARRAGVPLYRMLGAAPVESVPVYATAINPDGAGKAAAEFHRRGHRAFKLKIGFGREVDVRNISAVRDAVGDCAFMVDANQKWDLRTAIDTARAAEPYRLDWLEEPMRVDTPAAQWRELADATSIPLAGGENVRGEDFDGVLALGALRVVQPDVTKWGGISGNVRVVRKVRDAGRRFCPHYFAGGVGLLASLHLMAAFDSGSVLEFDPHPNAMRDLVIGSLLPVTDGRVPVPREPGLGIVPDLAALEPYRTWPRRSAG